MPTIPSEGSLPPAREPFRSPAPEPYRHREVAESFGSDAERYDRARPRYPRALIDRILTAAPGTGVLDVGCGTGIVARQFAAAGCRVLGVDVDARMAGLARQYGLEAEVAAFEAVGPGRPDLRRRRLRADLALGGPGGRARQGGTGAAARRTAGRVLECGQLPPRLAASFAEVYRRLLPDSLAARQWSASAVDGYAALCAKAADGIRAANAYGAPEQWRFDWEHTYTRDAWLDQVPTTGSHTRLSPAELDRVLAGIGAAIDAVGGSFTMRYSTLAVAAKRNAES
ncbi:Class I SAM-dependent methyltransferase OS=Streptomyces rimosus subsp. rimosus (strain ATCC / DSM 40260 / JCM 4667 / NRRL 2234) OX=1265868 GN=SRIM_038490 PE=4 SV=1 [Streptomyces rimosus subsp. rimosus]